MTPLIDDLRREEQLLTANLWARRLWPFGLALVTFLAGLYVGVRHRAPSQEDAKTVQALKDATDSLKVVRARALVLGHADTAASAIARAARDSVRVHQPAVNRAAAAVTVTNNPTDSTVTVQRPTAQGDTVTVADTIVTVPLPVATFIREAKPQLLRLTVAVHDDTLAMRVKDARITELVKGDSISKVQDSRHVEHEAHLEDERDSAYRRGVVKGVKVVLEVAALVGGVIKLVRISGR